MNLKTKIVFFAMCLTLLMSSSLSVAVPVLAVGADLDITCTGDGSCEVSPSGSPLFNETNMYPGYKVTHVLHIHNQTGETKTFNFQLKNFETSSDQATNLGNQVWLSVFGNSTLTQVLFEPQLISSIAAGPVILESFAPNQSRDYYFQLEFDQDAQNAYQNLLTQFDWQLGFDFDQPTPPLTPETTPQSQVSGAAAQESLVSNTATAPMCENPNLFSSGPGNFRVLSLGNNTLTLGWDAVDNAQSYAIFFTRLDGASYSVLPEYVAGATSFTITNLAASQYSFEIVAVGGNENLCSSSRAALTTSLTGGPVTGPPQTAAGQVLGAIDDEVKSQGKDFLPQGEVAGITAQACQQLSLALPWLLLAFQSILILSFEIWSRNSTSPLKHLMVFGITATSIGLYYLFRECDCISEVGWLETVCQWYSLLSLMTALFLKIISYSFIENVDKKI